MVTEEPMPWLRPPCECGVEAFGCPGTQTLALGRRERSVGHFNGRAG